MGIVILIASLIFYAKKKYTFLLYFYVFIAISIPSNEYLERLFFIKYGSIDVKILLLGLLAVITLTSIKSIKVNKFDYLIYIFLLITIVYFIFGKINNNQYLLVDFKYFVFLFILYFSSKMLINDNGKIIVLSKIILMSSLVYSCIVLYLYIFNLDSLGYIYGETLSNWWGNRVTFSNTSILPLTSIISIFFMLKSKRKFIYFFILIFNTLAIMISQSKTIIFSHFIILLILFIIIITNILLTKRINTTNFKYGFIIFYLLLLFICFGLNGVYKDNNLIGQIYQRYVSNNESLEVRHLTNKMVFQEISHNPLGYGLGKEMFLFNLKGNVELEGIFIDNLFLTVFYKLGIFGFLVICLLIISPIFYLFTLYMKFRSVIFGFLGFVYILFVFMVGYMSSQLIYSTSVCAFFMVFLSMLINNGIMIYDYNVVKYNDENISYSNSTTSLYRIRKY